MKNIFISMPLIFILIEYIFSIQLLHKHLNIWKIRKAELIFNKITSHKAETLLWKNSVNGIFQKLWIYGQTYKYMWRYCSFLYTYDIDDLLSKFHFEMLIHIILNLFCIYDLLKIHIVTTCVNYSRQFLFPAKWRNGKEKSIR